MSKRKKIESHYGPRIQPGRPSYDILDWSDPASQLMRFAVLVENVDLSGRSLLDVGCGLGDLYAYLRERKIAADYTGVDIVRKMVEEARRRHPESRFVWGDVFSDKPPEAAPGGAIVEAADTNPLTGRAACRPARFDVVFCSGVFNLNLGNQGQFLPRALTRLFELARTHVVVNLLHHRTAARYEHCVYYDPQEVQALLRDFPCRVRIVDHYLHNDFTVICELAVQ